jgi:hypothetical protein
MKHINLVTLVIILVGFSSCKKEIFSCNSSKSFKYPADTDEGKNVLHIDMDTLNHMQFYGMKVDMPRKCSELKVEIEHIPEDVKLQEVYWWYEVGSAKEWDVTVYNQTTHFQKFTTKEQFAELRIAFVRGTHIIRIFENDFDDSSIEKTIYVK